MNLQIQLFTFCMMFSSGWILGIVFDVYRVLTRPLKLSRISFSILDIIYWLMATLFVFKMLYESNDGQLRFYVFIGLLFGTWFYYAYVSLYTVQLIQFILRIVKQTIRIIYRIFQVLVIRPLVVLYKILVYFAGIIAAMAVFFFKIVVQLFYPITLFFKWLARKINGPRLKRSAQGMKRILKRFFRKGPWED